MFLILESTFSLCRFGWWTFNPQTGKPKESNLKMHVKTQSLVIFQYNYHILFLLNNIISILLFVRTSKLTCYMLWLICLYWWQYRLKIRVVALDSWEFHQSEKPKGDENYHLSWLVRLQYKVFNRQIGKYIKFKRFQNKIFSVIYFLLRTLLILFLTQKIRNKGTVICRDLEAHTLIRWNTECLSIVVITNSAFNRMF